MKIKLVPLLKLNLSIYEEQNRPSDSVKVQNNTNTLPQTNTRLSILMGLLLTTTGVLSAQALQELTILSPNGWKNVNFSDKMPTGYDTSTVAFGGLIAGFEIPDSSDGYKDKDATRTINRNKGMVDLDSLSNTGLTEEEKKDTKNYEIRNGTIYYNVTTFEGAIIIIDGGDMVRGESFSYTFSKNGNPQEGSWATVNDPLVLKKYLEGLLNKINSGEIKREKDTVKKLDKGVKAKRKEHNKTQKKKTRDAKKARNITHQKAK